jgi:hypothetical protein
MPSSACWAKMRCGIYDDMKMGGPKMKIRQAGPTMYEIRDSGTTVGHIWKHPEGWRAKIGAHEAMAATPMDAAAGVYAEVTGQSISEIAENNTDDF